MLCGCGARATEDGHVQGGQDGSQSRRPEAEEGQGQQGPACNLGCMSPTLSILRGYVELSGLELSGL